MKKRNVGLPVRWFRRKLKLGWPNRWKGTGFSMKRVNCGHTGVEEVLWDCEEGWTELSLYILDPRGLGALWLQAKASFLTIRGLLLFLKGTIFGTYGHRVDQGCS
jgi:hypothetical protein